MNTPLPPSSITSSPAPATGGCQGTPSRPRGSCPYAGSDLNHRTGNPLTNDAIQLTQTRRGLRDAAGLQRQPKLSQACLPPVGN